MSIILQPTDFSATAARAEAEAVAWARRVGAELVLLHVIAEPQLYGQGRVKLAERLRLQTARLMAAKRALARRVSRIRSRGIRARGLVRAGAPHREILSTARREGCDLIVMGTRGGGAAFRWLLGSAAERVVRRAPCPVLTVRR